MNPYLATHILPFLVVASVAPLIHGLIYFLVAVLVAVIVFWCISLFVTDARIKNVIGAIIALVLILYALTLFVPGL